MFLVKSFYISSFCFFENLSSIVEYVKEALVEFFLPDHALCRHSKDHKTLVWSLVYVDEFALLWHVIRLPRAFWVLISLVETVCKSHVHLNLDSSQVDLIVVVSHNQVLIRIMPEQWM